MLDKLALNILRMMFLIEGLIFGGLARVTRNSDISMEFELRSMSGWMLYGQPNILPEEMLKPILFVIKLFIFIIPFSCIWKVIKPLIIGV